MQTALRLTRIRGEVTHPSGHDRSAVSPGRVASATPPPHEADRRDGRSSLTVEPFTRLGVVEATTTNTDADVDDFVHLVVGVTAPSRYDQVLRRPTELEGGGVVGCLPDGRSHRPSGYRGQAGEPGAEGLKNRRGVERPETVNRPAFQQLVTDLLGLRSGGS